MNEFSRATENLEAQLAELTKQMLDCYSIIEGDNYRSEKKWKRGGKARYAALKLKFDFIQRSLDAHWRLP